MASDSYPSEKQGYHCSVQPLCSGSMPGSLTTLCSCLSRMQSAHLGHFRVLHPHSHQNPIVLFHPVPEWPHCRPEKGSHALLRHNKMQGSSERPPNENLMFDGMEMAQKDCY